MNKPHIHKDTIIAWANGAQIQYQDFEGEWFDVQSYSPSWSEGTNFRVKLDVETQLTDWLIKRNWDLSDHQLATQLLKKFNITLKD